MKQHCKQIEQVQQPLFFMVDQIKPAEKMAQFQIRKGLLWRLVKFLQTCPFNNTHQTIQ